MVETDQLHKFHNIFRKGNSSNGKVYLAKKKKEEITSFFCRMLTSVPRYQKGKPGICHISTTIVTRSRMDAFDTSLQCCQLTRPLQETAEFAGQVSYYIKIIFHKALIISHTGDPDSPVNIYFLPYTQAQAVVSPPS